MQEERRKDYQNLSEKLNELSKVKSEVGILNEKISSLRVETKISNDTLHELLNTHNKLALERNQTLLDYLKPLTKELGLLSNKVLEIDKNCTERGVKWLQVDDHIKDAKTEVKRKKEHAMMWALAAMGWLIAICTAMIGKKSGH